MSKRIMLFFSADGQQFAKACVVPENVSDDEARVLAKSAIEAVKASKPDQWTWDDVEKALVNKGFECHPVIGGEVWDF